MEKTPLVHNQQNEEAQIGTTRKGSPVLGLSGTEKRSFSHAALVSTCLVRALCLQASWRPAIGPTRALCTRPT